MQNSFQVFAFSQLIPLSFEYQIICLDKWRDLESVKFSIAIRLTIDQVTS